MNVGPWLKAFRLRTLPLALSSILMGGFLAASGRMFDWTIFLLCILTTIFLQILSNLANDYGDSIHGADSHHRTGPSRTVQSGEISSQAMKSAMILFILLSLISGISLLLVSFGYDWKGIFFFLILGLLSIGAAVAYTVGRKPYGYLGLGDVSVFIFFGMLGVLGSFYLFTKTVAWEQVFPAASCGFFSVAVLNVNNIRDIESDRKAGKFSVPVRIGKNKAVIYHWTLVIAGLICGTVYSIITYQSYFQFLFLLTVPLFLNNALAITKKPSQALDPYLKQMALSTLAFVFLFGLGILLPSF